MADTAVAVTTLTANAVSADILTTAEGGTAVTAGNVAVIAALGDTRDLFITLYNASGGATATVAAGANPPSHLAGLGATAALTIPAADALVLVLKAGQFVQANGTVRITIGTSTVVVGAYRVPNTV